MYSETHKAGTREFIFLLLFLLIFYTAVSSLKSIITPDTIITDIATIAVSCVIAYIVLVKYASVFEYSFDGNTLTAMRRTGRRSKSVSVPVRSIISGSKSAVSGSYGKSDMSASVLSGKRKYHVLYKDGADRRILIFEPSEKLIGLLKDKIPDLERNR